MENLPKYKTQTTRQTRCCQFRLPTNPWAKPLMVSKDMSTMGARIDEPVKTSSWVLELAVRILLSNIRGRGTVGKTHGNLAEQPSTICSAGHIWNPNHITGVPE